MDKQVKFSRSFLSKIRYVLILLLTISFSSVQLAAASMPVMPMLNDSNAKPACSHHDASQTAAHHQMLNEAAYSDSSMHTMHGSHNMKHGADCEQMLCADCDMGHCASHCGLTVTTHNIVLPFGTTKHILVPIDAESIITDPPYDPPKA